MSEDKGTVCVTGGTGFIASWLIMRLLDHGYSVRTTIRSNSTGKKRDLSFLTNLTGEERLRIFYADLNDPDSFDPAIEGCIGVFHVATPMDLQDEEPAEVITQRSINGTLGILKSCLKSKTVKRVVYTSSASAVVANDKIKNVDIMDETYWTEVDYVRKMSSSGNEGSYAISKTLTERKALEFAEEHGLDLVSVVPYYVIGPFICPRLPVSVSMVLAMVFGNREGYGNLLKTSMTHIDDVARAHIFLFENPDAKGRYFCSSHTLTIQEMAEFLSAKYPEFNIPTVDSLAEIKGFILPGLSSKKLLDTGFEFKYGVDEMFDGAIRCCKEKGYL